MRVETRNRSRWFGVLAACATACADDSAAGKLGATGDAPSSSGDASTSSTGGADTSTGTEHGSDGSTSSGDESTHRGEDTHGGDTTGEPPDTPIAPLEPGELRPGGDTTTEIVDLGAFVQEAANLSLLSRGAFEAGLQFVQLDWVPAPGQVEIDGLGPTYNAVSCIACHVRNGRGVPNAPGAPVAPGVLVRLGSSAGEPDPVYGNQLQPLAIPGVPAEGDVALTETIVGELPLEGGASVPLRRVTYDVHTLAFGPLADGTATSARLAQHLPGLGLLEAIAADDIVAWEDPDDTDGDGISGRAAWLPGGALGRFGWKAAQSSVEGQTAAAFLGDLGITSPDLIAQNCPPAQLACSAAPEGGAPELTATRLRVAAAYVRLLGVPARRDGEDDEVRRGKTLFGDAGCDRCHRPSYITPNVLDTLEPELAAQRIWPYTDLLLHDMGDGLADTVAEGDASGREWRTAPLWGLGVAYAVGGGLALLHDGRAASIEEAIAWHDGEAADARDMYQSFDATARERLLRFVESL